MVSTKFSSLNVQEIMLRMGLRTPTRCLNRLNTQTRSRESIQLHIHWYLQAVKDRVIPLSSSISPRVTLFGCPCLHPTTVDPLMEPPASLSLSFILMNSPTWIWTSVGWGSSTGAQSSNIWTNETRKHSSAFCVSSCNSRETQKDF